MTRLNGRDPRKPRWADRGLGCALAIVAMMLHVIVDVILRNVSNTPIPATYEIVTKYYMIALAFVPHGEVRGDQPFPDVDYVKLQEEVREMLKPKRKALEQDYALALEGESQRWVLTLVPSEGELQARQQFAPVGGTGSEDQA